MDVFAPLINTRFKVCNYDEANTRFSQPLEKCIQNRRDEACAKRFANSSQCDGGIFVGQKTW